jgi:hypothetical protein
LWLEEIKKVLYMLDRLLKDVRADILSLETAITVGPVPDFSTFLVLRGKLLSMKQMEEKIILLRKKEFSDDDDADSSG